MAEPMRLPRASGRADRRVDPRMRGWCDIIARLTAAGFAVTASLLIAGCVDGPPPFMVLNTDPEPAPAPDVVQVTDMSSPDNLSGRVWMAGFGEIVPPYVPPDNAAPLHDLVNFYVNDALNAVQRDYLGGIAASSRLDYQFFNYFMTNYVQSFLQRSMIAMDGYEYRWCPVWGAEGYEYVGPPFVPLFGPPLTDVGPRTAWLDPRAALNELSATLLRNMTTGNWSFGAANDGLSPGAVIGLTDMANTDAPLSLSWPTDQPLWVQPTTASQGAGATDAANTTPVNANQPLSGANTAGVPPVSYVPPYSTERLSSLTPATGYTLQLGGWLDTQPRLVPFGLGGVIDGPPPLSMMLEDSVTDDVVPVAGDLGVPLDEGSGGSSNAVATPVAEPATLPFYGHYVYSIPQIFMTLSDDDDDYYYDDDCDDCDGSHEHLYLDSALIAKFAEEYGWVVPKPKLPMRINAIAQLRHELGLVEFVPKSKLLIPSAINGNDDLGGFYIPGYGEPAWNPQIGFSGLSQYIWQTGRTDRWSDLPNTGTDTRPGTTGPATSSLSNRDLPGSSSTSTPVQPATASQDAGPTRGQQLLDGAKPLTIGPTATSPGPTSDTARRQQLLDDVKKQPLTGTSATSNAAPASNATRRQELLEQTNTSLKSEQTGARSTSKSDQTPRSLSGGNAALTDRETRSQMRSSGSRLSGTRHFSSSSAGTGGAGLSGRGGNASSTPSLMHGMAPGIGRTTIPGTGASRPQRGPGMHF